MSNIYNRTLSVKPTFDKVQVSSEEELLAPRMHFLDLIQDFENIKDFKVLSRYTDDSCPCFDVLINDRYEMGFLWMCDEVVSDIVNFEDACKTTRHNIWKDWMFSHIVSVVETEIDNTKYRIERDQEEGKLLNMLQSGQDFTYEVKYNTESLERMIGEMSSVQTGITLEINDNEYSYHLSVMYRYHQELFKMFLRNLNGEYTKEDYEIVRKNIIFQLTHDHHDEGFIHPDDDYDKAERELKEIARKNEEAIHEVVKDLIGHNYTRNGLLAQKETIDAQIQERLMEILSLSYQAENYKYKIFIENKEFNMDSDLMCIIGKPTSDVKIYKLY